MHTKCNVHPTSEIDLVQASEKPALVGVKITPLAAVAARLAVRLAAVIDAALQQLIQQLEVPQWPVGQAACDSLAPYRYTLA